MSDLFASYSSHRVEGCKTLGEAYEHRNRDPFAFIAGVQYALDKMLQEDLFHQHPGFPGPCTTAQLTESMAIEILERAKRGEPQ